MTARAGNTLLRVGALAAGLIGAALCWLYVHDAVIARLGDPDQSLAFWYLPILFLGLGGLALAVVLWLVAKHRVRHRDSGP